MQTTCCRVVEFDAGHRLLNHEGKCAHLHGHRYRCELHAIAGAGREGTGLDGLGRVVDFSVLKEKVGGWIDTNWDHGFLLNEADLQGIEAVGSVEPVKLYKMPCNPTAENIAAYIRKVVCPQVLAGSGVQVYKVVVWETPNCFAVSEV